MPGLVHFPSHSPITMTSRPPRPDEADVMRRFASHASRCATCADPYRVYARGGTLCRKGHAHAREVSEYVYTKGGRAMSVLERSEGGGSVVIEIPRGCEAVRGLLRALAEGLEIRKIKEEREREVVVRQDRVYDVQERRPREDRGRERERERERERAVLVEVARRREREREERRGRGREREREPRRGDRPYRGEERREDRRASYVPGRGSLYWADEEERRRGSPVIIVGGAGRYHR